MRNVMKDLVQFEKIKKLALIFPISSTEQKEDLIRNNKCPYLPPAKNQSSIYKNRLAYA